MYVFSVVFCLFVVDSKTIVAVYGGKHHGRKPLVAPLLVVVGAHSRRIIASKYYCKAIIRLECAPTTTSSGATSGLRPWCLPRYYRNDSFRMYKKGKKRHKTRAKDELWDISTVKILSSTAMLRTPEHATKLNKA